MDLIYFSKLYKIYTEKQVSDLTWEYFFEHLFKELSHLKPEMVNEEHLQFMKMAEEYFSHKEEFEKSAVLFDIQKASNDILETKRKIEEIKQKIQSLNK